MPIISIEACIGSGKSTLLDILKLEYQNNENVVFIPEPLDKWLSTKDENGKDILATFYEDKKRWGYSFQMNAFITRCKSLIEDQNKNKLLILERSIYTDKYVFANHLHQTGDINKLEMELYNEWFDWLADNFPVKPCKYIYLKCDTKVAHERVMKRAREAEMGHIPFEYLDAINSNHDKWLSSVDNVYTIDVNTDFQYNKSHKNKVLGTVCNIIDMELKELLGYKFNSVNQSPEQLALGLFQNVILRGNYNFELHPSIKNATIWCTTLSNLIDNVLQNSTDNNLTIKLCNQIYDLCDKIYIDDNELIIKYIIDKTKGYANLIVNSIKAN